MRFESLKAINSVSFSSPFFRPQFCSRFCLILGIVLEPQIGQNGSKIGSRIVLRKNCAQFSVSGRFLSILDPPESSKVSFSLKRGAYFHIFTRSPFFGRLGQTSRQHESNMHPNIGQNSAKIQYWTHRFGDSFLVSIFDQKWLQNGTPKFGAKRLFGIFWGCCFSHAIFGTPRLHFGVIWASF